MTSLARKAFAGLVGLFLVMAALLFGPPWTFDYWQAWLYLAVYFAASLALTLYPALVWRIVDEEKFLAGNLPGCAAYKQRVRYRLIPHVW